MLRYYVQPKRKMRPSKRTVRFETQPGYQLQHDWGEVEVEVAGQRCKVNFAVNTLGFSRRFHVFAAPKQDAEHTYKSLVRAFRYFGGCVKTVLVDNQKAAVLKNNNGKSCSTPDSCCWPTTITSCHGHAVHAGPEQKVRLSGW